MSGLFGICHYHGSQQADAVVEGPPSEGSTVSTWMAWVSYSNSLEDNWGWLIA